MPPCGLIEALHPIASPWEFAPKNPTNSMDAKNAFRYRTFPINWKASQEGAPYELYVHREETLPLGFLIVSMLRAQSNCWIHRTRVLVRWKTPDFSIRGVRHKS